MITTETLFDRFLSGDMDYLTYVADNDMWHRIKGLDGTKLLTGRIGGRWLACTKEVAMILKLLGCTLHSREDIHKLHE